MDSDDDFGPLETSEVRELRTRMGPKTASGDDKSSSEDEATSIKSESDGEEVVLPCVTEHTELDSVKSEPESQSDDNSDDDERSDLISSYVSASKSKLECSDSSDESQESSDEYDVKSEAETEDETNQAKNELVEDKDQNMDSIDIVARVKKGDKSSVNTKKKEAKKQKSKKNDAEGEKEVQVDQPSSRKEKELMSLVFGGKAALVSQLNRQERNIAKDKRSTQPEEDVRTTDDKSKTKRAAIWHDSDDDDEEDSANIKRNKFSRLELPEQVNKERRRKQFEQIVGKPKWADLDRVVEPDSDDEILRTVGHVLKGTPSQGLPNGMIELKKLKNLNRETKNEGEISSINFHPTSMVAVITGKRGLVSIVAVDGVRNEKLHTLWLPKMRVVCSSLSPDGDEAVFGSYRKFFHVYNLISGQSYTRKIPERATWLMKNFRVSQCGKYLASVGECGEVHLMSAKSKEMLQTIQLRQVCSSLAFTPDSKYLLCHSNDTDVSVFSLEKKRIVNMFIDDGCVNGSCIAICPNGQYVATGSRQGIVNIYAVEVTLTQKQPVPLKTFSNLTTYIDSLSFNATSELLVIASSTIKNAVKLIHVRSGTVFRNFPLYMTHLGHITAAQFSPAGGYLALGTKQSTVLLYRVKHYPNY
ncbi:U3 small nucleolar RNA-associated protein 18 homolog [Anopheles marshallii]|uniref:U3 small nucleolar RNA-associated protein 18 homolog n=1 Tax=Anopheles marshallii TaxID=1521116 RepID=UPI00237A8668|nr:U3 small nucleolar RNA-associated protein 18 homolog [Anopheles marshallii]